VIIRAWGVVDEGFSIIQDGAVAVRHGLIVSVGRFDDVKREDGGPVYEFGDSLILPGLVNAHTHLELTALAGKVPPRGGFVGWLRALMGELKGWQREDFITSCKEGLKQSARSGTTLIGDITRPTLPLDHYHEDPLRKVVYLELMGFGQFFSAALVLGVRMRLGRLKQNESVVFGLSPHAPYSAAPELYIRACNAKNDAIPLCTHIAESEEELLFLRTGKGPLRKLLAEIGVDLTSFKAPGLRAVEYLHSLGVLSENLTLIHANYLSDEEIELIAGSGASVVYCPRSHAYFGHKVRCIHIKNFCRLV